jgi:hypothetical protein
MCASPLRFLRAGPPPPKVALLPDALFFTRAIPVTKGATPAEAASQIELALESVSPFPLTQLYYGWFWLPGSEHAMVFAAYRRRFTAEQTADWEGAELVLPNFASVLGGDVDAGSTVLLNTPEGVTALHWGDGPVVSKILFRPANPDGGDDERARVRDDVLREVGGSRKVIDVDAPLTAEPSLNDREIEFRSGDFVSRLTAAHANVIDVRDKGDLAALRNARKRDVLLWRLALGAAAALVLLGIGELALLAGRQWQNGRERQYRTEKPLVDQITRVHELTTRIEDLSTKRLLPLEMVTQVVGENNERIPGDIQFTRVHSEQALGLYTLYIEGKTENAPQVNAYEATLKNLPAVQSATARLTQTTGSRAQFTITVVFKPGILNPTGTAVVSR